MKREHWPYKIYATQVDGIGYSRIHYFGGNHWSFVRIEDDQVRQVGPQYLAKEMLLQDMARYLRDSWGVENF